LIALTVQLSAGSEDVAADVAAEVEEVGEKHGFQAEVSKMLDIIINALYTNRDIFLREVISNASDALDKIRFLYLTEPRAPKNKDGEEPKMDIRIKLDKENRILTVSDGGVGMTKGELVAHLGSLGSSGTKDFAEKMQESSDAGMIGQFGVGFYSVFLVADEVRVATKSDDSDTQWVWKSKADGDYYVYEDPRGDTLGRGTEIQFEIKKDAEEYLDESKLREIAQRYSEFIQFPIYLQVEKTEKVKVENVEKEKTESTDDEDVAVEEEEEEQEDVFEDVVTHDWELLNVNKPIWQRKSEDVSEEEYSSFYKAITKDYRDPMYKTHFSAEGEVEFRSLLFIPSKSPNEQWDMNQEVKNIRLYVRRVFITDDFQDLLPRYLSFIKGVVDSDDLPLNVSRELLQESRILKIIKKKLIRKALAMMKDLADADEDSVKDEDEEAEEKTEAEQEAEKEAAADKGDEEVEKKEKKYPKFWEEFGKSIRLGLIEDGTNRSRLTKLLRYKTTASDDNYVSLDQYVDRMIEGQKDIYFLVGESVEKIEESPACEDAVKRGLEVLLMTDAIDEYVVGQLTDYSGHKLVNLAKEAPKLEGDDDKQAKKVDEKRKEVYQPLCDWFKELLADKVTKVVLTKRKTTAPMVVSSPAHGMTANMMRITKGQTLGRDGFQPELKRVLELNHLNPVVDEINKRVAVNKDDSQAKDTAKILYEVASIQSGFEVEDAKDFAGLLDRMLKAGLDLEPDAGLVEEEEYELDDEEEEDEEEEGEEAPVDEEL